MFKTLPIVIVCFSLFACNSAPVAENKIKKATQEMPNIDLLPAQKGGYKNINNEQLQKLSEKGIIIVDIRRKEEWQQTGIIKGSKTITFFDKSGNVSPDFIPKFTNIADRENPVILICRTGNRTKAASQALIEQLGYKTVLNVTNGITSWISEKRPIEQYK